MSQLAKILMLVGALLFLLGMLIAWGPRIPWLGKLPGDFLIKTDSFTLYIPLTTSLLISLLLSLLFLLYHKWR